VQAGEIEDPTFLPVLLEPPEGFDWRDSAVWAFVNPALGVFRSFEEMQTSASCSRVTVDVRLALGTSLLPRIQPAIASRTGQGRGRRSTACLG
jgi:hypothetical protein